MQRGLSKTSTSCYKGYMCTIQFFFLLIFALLGMVMAQASHPEEGLVNVHDVQLQTDQLGTSRLSVGVYGLSNEATYTLHVAHAMPNQTSPNDFVDIWETLEGARLVDSKDGLSTSSALVYVYMGTNVLAPGLYNFVITFLDAHPRKASEAIVAARRQTIACCTKNVEGLPRPVLISVPVDDACPEIAEPHVDLPESIKLPVEAPLRFRTIVSNVALDAKHFFTLSLHNAHDIAISHVTSPEMLGWNTYNLHFNLPRMYHAGEYRLWLDVDVMGPTPGCLQSTLSRPYNLTLTSKMSPERQRDTISVESSASISRAGNARPRTFLSHSDVAHQRNSERPLLCLVVPFRDGCGWHGKDRLVQLDEYLDYMKQWLIDRGHTHFLFVVSEQSQAGLFNKGLMFNLGALVAFRAGCEHLIFHDVDQFPTNPLNDYVYRGTPTHMCTWSSMFERPDEPMRPHVGGALMMSRDDYIAVNGYSNRYWGWGLEDNDMYQRLYAVFHNVTRLPQAIGSYTAMGHHREDLIDLQGTDEYKSSQSYFTKMQSPDVQHARSQLEADGLRQACEYGDLLHAETDASRFLLIATFDLLDRHASPCIKAPPNAIKMESEKRYRCDLSTRGRCRVLLQEAEIQQGIVPAKRLCTFDGQFCVKTWTDPDIQHNTLRFDNLSPFQLPAGNLLMPRLKVPVCELLNWMEIWRVLWSVSLKPSDFVNTLAHGENMLKIRRELHVGHPFMMGWNESMAYLRMLIRKRFPFSVARYGDGELKILSNQTLAEQSEWNWNPHHFNAEKFLHLFAQPFEYSQSSEHIMMIGLPIPFCSEGMRSWKRGGGGD